MVQQAPEHPHLPVHAVRRADHQNGAVQNAQHALHLRGEIRVSRRIQQCIAALHVSPLRHEPRLLGEDRDASLFFHLIGIQERVAVVHAPGIPDRSRDVEQRLGERRLARVHVSQDAEDQILFFHIYSTFITCNSVFFHSIL